MTEKVLHEFKLIETEDGFRVEVKGDKEKIKKMGFGRMFGMGFGSSRGRRHGRGRWRKHRHGRHQCGHHKHDTAKEAPSEKTVEKEA